MAKILLVAVNAAYNHTNLAVRSICEYVKQNDSSVNIDFVEFTINQKVSDILRGIYESEADLVLFCTYIWNSEIIQKILPEVKKILPDCMIGAGGPEFGFFAEGYLSQIQDLDFVIKGEGEQTVLEIAQNFTENKSDFLQNIRGIYLKKGERIIFNGERDLICDLSTLPFAYPQIDFPDNLIYYYESSRGCPYSCSYCMSSLDKRVRFMSLERVFDDLQRFLDANVRLVKFVDRTYNLNPERYIAIWKYIVEHHNKKTMFHFEIEAEFLSEEALEFLQTIPANVMQFEIGVQSANKKTLQSICRSTGIEKIAQNVKRIPPTIHKHLDLIAGLPHEDLDSFGKSFDFVMSLKPDAMQLGFLKVLHGTQMETFAKENGWQWMKNPVYETLSTPYLSYADMIFLKDVEVVTDAFWNSGEFCKSMIYIEEKIGFWNFFCKIVAEARKEDVFSAPRRTLFWFEFLAKRTKLFDSQNKTLKELLRFDYISSGKKGGFPAWYEHRYNKENHRLALEQNGGVINARLDFAYSDYEEFSINPVATTTEEQNIPCKILFMYPRRQKDTKDLKTELIEKTKWILLL